MFRTLRCFRLLALPLLIATPGALGTVLQTLHPCPVATPWMPQSAGSESGHHDGHGGDSGSAPSPCQCVGACQVAPTWVSPASSPRIVARTVVRGTTTPAVEAPDAPRARPDRLLPPATAPPRG
jgi:hypothetical protein